MIDEILTTNGNIYQTIVPREDITLVYRLLSLKEYNVYRSLRSGEILTLEETAMSVFERCFLGEASFLSDNMPAGILISIGNLILWLSGDCDQITLVDDLERHKQLNPSDTIFSYIQAVIVTAFPTYTLEEMESWDREHLLKKFTIAENVLEKQREGYQRLQLEKVDPNKPKKTKHGIDFDKENAALRSHQNPFDMEEAQQQVEENKLNKEQLRKLNHMRR